MIDGPVAFIAVDLGASGGKLSLGTFGAEGFSLQEVHRFDNAGVNVWAHGRQGQAAEKTYWDDLAIFANIVEGMRRAAVVAKAPVAGIGIDAWGADAALLNAHGECLGPVHCYRDHRLDTIRDELFRRISPRELFDLSGTPSQPWYLINQLLWLSRHRPELLAMTETVLPFPGLMDYYLCGSRMIDESWMACQQLTRAGVAEYDERLLSAAGVERRIMPKIVAPGTVVGELRAELAAGAGLPGCKVIAVKAHDTACAFTAAPVADPGDSLIISSGTWSLVGKVIDEPLINDEVFEAGLSNEGVRGDVRLLKNVMGNWPVQQLRAAWARADGREMTWDEIVTLAESARPRAVRVDVDDPALFNPPDMEAAIRRQIERTGQPQPADRGGLLRTVYEGLAGAVAQVNSTLERVTGRRNKVVHVVGGGARNAFLNQLIADATGLPLHAGPYEAAGIGNILVQAVSCGVFDSLASARRAVAAAFPTRRFDPRGRPAR